MVSGRTWSPVTTWWVWHRTCTASKCFLLSSITIVYLEKVPFACDESWHPTHNMIHSTNFISYILYIKLSISSSSKYCFIHLNILKPCSHLIALFLVIKLFPCIGVQTRTSYSPSWTMNVAIRKANPLKWKAILPPKANLTPATEGIYVKLKLCNLVQSYFFFFKL